MRSLWLLGMLFAQLSYAVEIKSTRLEASSLELAAEKLYGHIKMHYANRENILYLQYLEEHPEIAPPTQYWRMAVEYLALNRLMENCVDIGLISEEERENAFKK